jgi:hypothetical protein
VVHVGNKSHVQYAVSQDVWDARCSLDLECWLLIAAARRSSAVSERRKQGDATRSSTSSRPCRVNTISELIDRVTPADIAQAMTPRRRKQYQEGR